MWLFLGVRDADVLCSVIRVHQLKDFGGFTASNFLISFYIFLVKIHSIIKLFVLWELVEMRDFNITQDFLEFLLPSDFNLSGIAVSVEV